jgi:hypothetical protein
MNSKNRKKHILVPLISAILIVIVGMLNIDFYFKSVMFPFLMILISSTILVKDYEGINKKAYLLIIPIVLIIISNLVLKVLKCNLDGTNQLLNIIVLPLLISTYLFMLVRSDFKVSLENMFLVFKLFPKNLFKNLKFIKIDNVKDLKLLDDKEIIVKYYVKKIHYFNECNNVCFEYGEPYYIYNVGYFYIGGFIENKNAEELSRINKLFQDYNDNYDKMSFPFSDSDYLNLNK